ncbi:MAG: zinc-binding dehydrogenase [Myxococcota bacterium]
MGETMTAMMLTRKGGPEVLVKTELPLPEPGPGELRVRVRATGVGSTDVTMRRGYYPFAPKLPFAPGYESVGIVDAIGAGVTGFRLGERVAALLVYGGYATHVVRGAEEWFKVPQGLSDASVAALILNYGTAYQAIHRTAAMRPGQTALVTGAAGGVGQALVQLLVAHGVRVIAAASRRSHPILSALGAEPIEGRQGPIDGATLALVPGGVDACFDGIGGDQLRQCIGATKRGGVVVWYGFMGLGGGIWGTLRNVFDLFVAARLRGRIGRFYGITALYRRDPRPLREDVPKLLELLGRGAIAPRIALTLPLTEAVEANRRLEAGGLDGKIILSVGPQ